MYIPISDSTWVEQHAVQGEDGKWQCKETKAVIRIIVTGRSIWIRPFTGGFGEVRKVGHLYCPKCTPNTNPPQYGAPIYEDELVQVGKP